jgi:hypothetical protein
VGAQGKERKYVCLICFFNSDPACSIAIQYVNSKEILSEPTCTVVIETFDERLQPKDMASVNMEVQ